MSGKGASATGEAAPAAPASGGHAEGVPRRVLWAIRTAAPGTGLDDIARQLRLSRDEVEAAVGYWLFRGELGVRRVDCAPADCSGCVLRSSGCTPAPPASGPHPGGNRTSINILTS